jgi:hypothetical protein
LIGWPNRCGSNGKGVGVILCIDGPTEICLHKLSEITVM